MVHEQTARIVPETAATVYASHFFAFAPKYFKTDPWLINTEMTPAMKNAGSKHRMTCSRAYHFTRSSVASIAVVNLALSMGKKKANRKTTMIQASIFISFLDSINFNLKIFQLR